MTNYLLDTNTLLRSVYTPSLQRTLALDAIATLLQRGHRVFITSQTVVEFWAVATRPREANGFGWTPADVNEEIELFFQRFAYLEETPQVFGDWLQLVNMYHITGRRVYDTRLVAVMLAHGITHILTFNVADFAAYQAITVVHPDEIA